MKISFKLQWSQFFQKESSFFANRQEAISFLSTASADASLRTTTLEDVFVERIGSRLMKR